MNLSFEGISLGILFFRWNGLLITLGITAGALLSMLEAKRRREDVDLIYHLFLPAVALGLIGARLWYIFAPPLSSVKLGLTTHYYLSHLLDSLALWIGGYGLPGLWIGVAIALIFISRHNDIPFLDLADLLAPGFALAQAIGRLGNYFNRELYGLPTALPWGIFIPSEYRFTGFESVEYYHPLFAYESILSFINLALLLWLARRYLKSGHLFLVYIVFYSSARILLEFLRIDVALVNDININQAFFAATFICAVVGLYWLHRPAEL